MATKRSLQQCCTDDEDRKGKKVLFKDDEEKGSQKEANLIINQEVDTKSSKIDSSSESDKEVEEEDLDPWERAAREMYSPKEETTGWTTWTLQQSAIIEMGVLASTLEAVPNQDVSPNDNLDEFIFDFDYPDENEVPDEDPVAAEFEQVAEDQDINDDPVTPAAPIDQHASADAQATVPADLSSDPHSTN